MVPPPLPPLPPPLPSPARQRLPKSAVFALTCIMIVAGVFVCREIQEEVKNSTFPSGYRDRPTVGLVRIGEKEFDAADAQIDSFGGTNAFGNSPEAVRLARRFSEAVKIGRRKLFTSGFDSGLFEQTNGEFLTYCELHARECAFIVHVPPLRKFEDGSDKETNARKALAQLAWSIAQEAIKKPGRTSWGWNWRLACVASASAGRSCSATTMRTRSLPGTVS